MKNFIDFKILKRSWERKPCKMSSPFENKAKQSGFKILENILNQGAWEINKDLLFFHKGHQLKKEYSGNLDFGINFISSENTKQIVKTTVLTSGASLKISQVSRFSQEVRSMEKHLAKIFGVPISSNLYYTPPYSKCFSAHCDPYNIFVQQLAGKKFWNLSEVAKLSDLKKNAFTSKETLMAGDFLYLPKNSWHEAYTKNESSVHITFGLHPVPLNQYLEKLFSESYFKNYFEEISGVYLSTKPDFFSPHHLTEKMISQLTDKFRAHLVKIKRNQNKSDPDVQSYPSFSIELPQDFTVLPDTFLKFNVHSKSIASLNQVSSKTKKALKKLKNQGFFFAGELVQLTHPDLNWEETLHLIQNLLENNFISLSSPKKQYDPLSDLKEILNESDFYYYFGKNKSLNIFKTGDKDGFLVVNKNQVRKFIILIKQDSDGLLKQINNEFKTQP
jgi:ribosomal protein L16 Arg81 hydroxylase